jgi:hypothetical protein
MLVFNGPLCIAVILFPFEYHSALGDGHGAAAAT